MSEPGSSKLPQQGSCNTRLLCYSHAEFVCELQSAWLEENGKTAQPLHAACNRVERAGKGTVGILDASSGILAADALRALHQGYYFSIQVLCAVAMASVKPQQPRASVSGTFSRCLSCRAVLA